MAEHQAPARVFSSGATRDVDTGKFDYEGFLSPRVIEAFGRYMHICRKTPTGLRNSDNWQLGIPLDTYIKSLWRHFMDMWKVHRGIPTKEHQIINAVAVMFNTMGYLHETLQEAAPAEIEAAFKAFEASRAAEIAARTSASQAAAPSRSPKSGSNTRSRRAGRR